MLIMTDATSSSLSAAVIVTWSDDKSFGTISNRANVSASNFSASLVIDSRSEAITDLPYNFSLPWSSKKSISDPASILMFRNDSSHSNLWFYTTKMNGIETSTKLRISDAMTRIPNCSRGEMSDPESGVSRENVHAVSSNFIHDGRGAFSRVTAYLFSPAFRLVLEVARSKVDLKLFDG